MIVGLVQHYEINVSSYHAIAEAYSKTEELFVKEFYETHDDDPWKIEITIEKITRDLTSWARYPYIIHTKAVGSFERY